MRKAKSNKIGKKAQSLVAHRIFRNLNQRYAIKNGNGIEANSISAADRVFPLQRIQYTHPG